MSKFSLKMHFITLVVIDQRFFIYAIYSLALDDLNKHHASEPLHVIYFFAAEVAVERAIADDADHSPTHKNSSVQDAAKVTDTDMGSDVKNKALLNAGSAFSEHTKTTTSDDEMTRHPKAAELIGSIPAPDLQFANRLPWERSPPIRDIPLNASR